MCTLEQVHASNVVSTFQMYSSERQEKRERERERERETDTECALLIDEMVFSIDSMIYDPQHYVFRHA